MRFFTAISLCLLVGCGDDGSGVGGNGSQGGSGGESPSDNGFLAFIVERFQHGPAGFPPALRKRDSRASGYS